MTPGERKKEELASLRIQLAQLNTRVNFQQDHAWKVPLSLLAVAGAMLYQSVGKPTPLFAVAVAVGVLLFVMATLHFIVTTTGIYHTVDQIHRIEDMLGLPRTHRDERERTRLLLPRMH